MWGMQPNPVNGTVYIGTLFNFMDKEGLWASYDNAFSFQRVGDITRPSSVEVKMVKVANDSSVYVLNASTLYRVDPQPTGSIAGSIRDSSGVSPLLLADIRVVETDDFLSMNNDSGRYKMQVAAGTYTLRFETSGSSPVFVSNVTVVEGQETVVNVDMPIKRSLASLQGTVTTDGLYYVNEVGFRIDTIVSLDKSGTFQFDSLSTLDQLDSLIIIPETLPLLPYKITNLVVDTVYNVPLQRADVLITAKDNDAALETKFYLNRQGISSSVQSREISSRDFSPSIVNYTNYQTLVWVGEGDFTLMSPSALDSLERSVVMGQNLLMSGQVILENNSQEPFFANMLMIDYVGNYGENSPLLRGFSGNTIADNLLFVIGNQLQPSRDIIRSSHPSAQNAISYGDVIDDSSRVGALNYDNTGLVVKQ